MDGYVLKTLLSFCVPQRIKSANHFSIESTKAMAEKTEALTELPATIMSRGRIFGGPNVEEQSIKACLGAGPCVGEILFGPLETFTLFPNLPLEIKTWIWSSFS